MSTSFKSFISETSRSLKSSLAFALILETISNLQTIHIILKTTLTPQGDENYPVSKYLRQFTSYVGELNQSNLFDETDATIQFVWFLFAGYLVIHVLLFLATVLTHRRKSISTKKSKIQQLLFLFYLLHSRILFYIGHYFFLGIISSYTNCNLRRNTAFYCKTAWFAPTILLCILNIGLAIVKETFLYTINKTKNAYAIKTNIFHECVLLHKIIAVILYFIVWKSNTKDFVNPIINTVVTLFALCTLYVKLPFYNTNVMKVSIVFTGIAFSLSLVSIFQNIGADRSILDTVCIGIAPLVIKILLMQFNSLSERIIQGNFSSPERAIYFVTSLEKYNFGYLATTIYNDKSSLGSVLSNGLLVRQKVNRDHLQESRNKSEHEEEIYVYILEKLTTILDKNPTSELLLLFMAQICLKKLKNIPKTIIFLKRLEALRLSIVEKNSFDEIDWKLKRFNSTERVEEEIVDHLSMLTYFKYRNFANEMKDNIKAEVLKHVEFWEEIRKEGINGKQIVNIVQEIDSLSAQTQKKWHETANGFARTFLNSIAMYGAYLAIIKEHLDDARKTMKNFWSISRNTARPQAIDVYTEETAVVIISIEKSNVGKIIDASGSTQTIFQIDKRDLIGHHLTSILPCTTAKSLLQAIINYAKSPSNRFNYVLKSYGKAQNDDFFDIEIRLQLYPQVDREVKLMILFKKLSSSRPVLIVDTEGIVVECSENLKQAFNLDNTNKDPIKLQSIVSEYEAINAAFNLVYANKKSSDMSSGLLRKSQSQLKLPRTLSSLTWDETVKNYQDTSNYTKTGQKKVVKMGQEKLLEKNSPTYVANLPQEKYRELCNSFIKGKKLKFMPLNTDSGSRYETMYDVQITPYQIDGEVYKVFLITPPDEAEDEQKMIDEMLPKDLLLSKEGTLSSGFAADFPDNDERKVQEKKKLYAKKTLQVYDDKSEKLSHKIFSHLKTKNTSSPLKVYAKVPKNPKLLKDDKSQTGHLVAKVKLTKGNSISSTSSASVASVKILKGIFERKGSYPLGRNTTITILLITIAMSVLLIINYSLSRTAVLNVQAGIGIINIANLRLSETMRAWQFASRFKLRHLGITAGVFQPLQASMYQKALGMLKRNAELTQEMSSQVQTELFEEIFAQDISIYDLYSDKTFNDGKTDTFTATPLLANKMIATANLTQGPDTPKILENIQYILNGTGNDYLVSSERLISSTKKMLQTTISNSISTLQLLLGFEGVSLALLCLSLVFAARIIIRSYRTLFHVFIKIGDNHIDERLEQLQRMKTLLSEDIETRNFGSDALNAYRPPDALNIRSVKSKAKDLKKGGFHKREGRLNMRQILLYLVKYVGISLIVIQAATGLFVVSLLDSISNFKTLDKVNNRLSVTTKAGYQVNVAISVFYVDVLFRNDTSMLVRNELPTTQLLKSVQTLSNLNPDLLSVFTQEGGGFADPFIDELFQEKICKFLSQTDTTLQDYCTKATEGGRLGLLSVNSKIFMAADSYTKTYLTEPTLDAARRLLTPYSDIMRPCAEALQAAYEFLNAHILDEVDKAADVFLIRSTILHVCIFVTIIICWIIVQSVTIKRLRELDMTRGKILKVISYTILLENKAVGFYVNKYFINKSKSFAKRL